MASASREIPKGELASRLEGLMPSKVAQKVAQNNLFRVPRQNVKRILLSDMEPKQRKLVTFPLEELKGAGVEVPRMGKKAVFISSGPENGQLINKTKESVAFRLRGKDIICSVNGSAPIKLGLKGGKRNAEYL